MGQSTNPYINRIYIERDTKTAEMPTDVLVVETNISLRDIERGRSDVRLDDILLDLGDLAHFAENRIGHFERIDIRSF